MEQIFGPRWPQAYSIDGVVRLVSLHDLLRHVKVFLGPGSQVSTHQ